MHNFKWKSLKLEDLKWAYENMPFKIEPRRHQYISLAFAADKNRVGFWHDPGTGKTLAAYWSAMQWGCKKIAVICPSSAIGSWVRDIKHTDYTYQIISGETEDRREKINQNQQVSIIQWEWLKTIYSKFTQPSGYEIYKKNLTLEEATEYYEKDPKKKIVQDKKTQLYKVMKTKSKGWMMDLSTFTQDFDCVIFDEMHRCSDSSTRQSKICLELSKYTQHVIGLSGTPVDKWVWELFHIYNVLDLGETFGDDFWFFRLENFYQSGFDWKFRDGKKDLVMEQWAKSSLSFAQSECFDLPQCLEETILVQPTKEFLDLEKKLLTGKPIKSKKVSVSWNLPSTKAAKLKQLTDGFIYLEEEGTRLVHRMKENSKLEAVLELFESGKKIIVFYEYIEVGNILAEALTRLQIGFVALGGGLEPQERLNREYLFQNDPATQGALAQIQAASEGWDGFAADIIVFFDVVPSPRVRKQCKGRMLRDGQTKPTIVYEILVQGSINEMTKKNQGERKTEVQEYMDYVRDYNKK